MDELDLINKKIEDSKVIAIYGHSLPDGDCYGCQIGLKEAILSRFPNKKVYCFGSGLPKFFDLISKMDKDIEPSYDLGILVDVSCLSRAEDKSIYKCKDFVKFDHHCKNRVGEEFPYLNYVDENRIACTEIIYDFIHRYNYQINKICASALYLGLVTDSGRFCYYGTNKHSFEIAANLIKKGADPKSIIGIAFFDTEEVKRFKSYMREKAKLYKDITYLIVKKEEYISFGLSFEEASCLVNAIAGVYSCHSFVYFCEDEHGGYRVELRSNKMYPVVKTAQLFGGGGHEFASGITLKKGNPPFNQILESMASLECILKLKEG